MTTKKILLVDDDQDLLRGMSLSLKASGYQVALAQDAIGAVSTARQEQPDLIVLDLGLPGGDGFLVMERLAGFKNLIPVIVVSAQQSTRERALEVKSLEAGARAYFQKPVDRKEFMMAVRKALREPKVIV
jgi:DNA-binding response OmpR family regulator